MLWQLARSLKPVPTAAVTRTGQNVVAGLNAEQARSSDVWLWVGFAWKFQHRDCSFRQTVRIMCGGAHNDYNDHTSALSGLCGYWQLDRPFRIEGACY